MKPSEHKKLLNELLPDERLADFRTASLQHSLASLRRHRRRRLLFRASALTVVACLMVCGLLLKDRHPAHNTVAAVSSRSTAPESDHVKFINDDELLAMFPQGSVALVGKPGRQRLVFLDTQQSETPESPKVVR